MKNKQQQKEKQKEQQQKKMTKAQFTNELIRAFGDKTGCRIQYKGCPCNTCFHNIGEHEDEDIDFKHICWIMLLHLRGDYKDDYEEGIELIRKELHIK
jgi:hypothetical protein